MIPRLCYTGSRFVLKAPIRIHFRLCSSRIGKIFRFDTLLLAPLASFPASRMYAELTRATVAVHSLACCIPPMDPASTAGSILAYVICPIRVLFRSVAHAT